MARDINNRKKESLRCSNTTEYLVTLVGLGVQTLCGWLWGDPVHMITEHGLGYSQVNANVLPGACITYSTRRVRNNGVSPFVIKSGYSEYSCDPSITNAS